MNIAGNILKVIFIKYLKIWFNNAYMSEIKGYDITHYKWKKTFFASVWEKVWKYFECIYS